MTAVNLTAYDKVAYPAYVYGQAHPDRLATVATVLGLSPTPVEHCRVLELACGDGGNLLPMALDLPESEFLGIDLAGLPITKGQQLIQALGFKNIELRRQDLMSFSGEAGSFDYIIAHGLYSWVPETVRNQILSICAKCLSAQGVAYISYNAYPGCHIREITRGIMRFHTKDVIDAADKVAQSRAVIKWVAAAQSRTNSYATLMTEMSGRLDKRPDGSIYHDELSDMNNPVYFHQFIEHASQHGLQFLSEADYFESSVDSSFSPEVTEQLEQLGRESILAREQYLDFLKGRSFRQTLLCHRELELRRPIDPDRIKGLLIRSNAQSSSPVPDIRSSAVEQFQAKNDAQATTNLPLAKAAFVHLANIYPRAISFAELVQDARTSAGTDQTPINKDIETLAAVITKTYEVGVLELLTHEPGYAVTPGAFPLASPLARLQAQQNNVVTTMLHASLKLQDPLALQLLMLLDGSRDRTALIREFTHSIETSSQLTLSEKQAMMEELPGHLDDKLAELGRLGLLSA